MSEPPASGPSPRTGDAQAGDDDPSLTAHLLGWLRGLRKGRDGETTTRAALEELIEERTEAETAINADERALLLNILALRDRTIEDVMVPRADVVAVEAGAALAEVVAVMTREGHSRLPVYRETLDDALGMVHIKDVLAWRGKEAEFALGQVLRKVLFVAPSMRVLELLLEMRARRVHMALVVDEYGGIDGLVTIEDVVEEIVGEIEDEHDRAEPPGVLSRPDGTLDADARLALEDFERIAGPVLSDEERAEVDTLGGLVFSLAGRVPIRGELVTHPSGLEFEVLDADPRRIRRLRVRKLAEVRAREVVSST